MQALVIRLLRLSGAAALIAAVAGCGDEIERVEAGGVVTYKGKPVPNAVVTFLPETAGVTAEAITDAEGKFTLSSTGVPGAPTGKYRARVVAVEEKQVVASGMSEEQKKEEMMNAMFGKQSPPKYRVPKKYADVETSGLSAEVTDDPEKNRFELKLE